MLAKAAKRGEASSRRTMPSSWKHDQPRALCRPVLQNQDGCAAWKPPKDNTPPLARPLFLRVVALFAAAKLGDFLTFTFTTEGRMPFIIHLRPSSQNEAQVWGIEWNEQLELNVHDILIGATGLKFRARSSCVVFRRCSFFFLSSCTLRNAGVARACSLWH